MNHRELRDMNPEALDCTRVQEGEYERLYVQGKLSDPDAEAFEAHYFACDRCWAAVQQALELQAAFESPAAYGAGSAAGAVRMVPPASERSPRHDAPGATFLRPRAPRWSWNRRWTPALAAAVLVLAVGTWQMARRAGDVTVQETERGAARDLRVRPVASTAAIGAAWSPVPGADRYHVQLFAADGTELADRELADTSVSIPRGAISASSTNGAPPAAYWSVEAFDATGHSLGKSRLTPAAIPPPT
jgi:anti-sigma factor RsiW